MFKKDEENTIRWQMSQYKRERMPVGYGQFACNVIVRENNNSICCSVMSDWWQEVFTRSYRDQLSFMYCLWKRGLGLEDVGCLEGDWSQNNELWQNGHNPQK